MMPDYSILDKYAHPKRKESTQAGDYSVLDKYAYPETEEAAPFLEEGETEYEEAPAVPTFPKKKGEPTYPAGYKYPQFKSYGELAEYVASKVPAIEKPKDPLQFLRNVATGIIRLPPNLAALVEQAVFEPKEAGIDLAKFLGTGAMKSIASMRELPTPIKPVAGIAEELTKRIIPRAKEPIEALREHQRGLAKETFEQLPAYPVETLIELTAPFTIPKQIAGLPKKFRPKAKVPPPEEIAFPGIKEKIVPSETPIPKTVLEEVLGLKKKKARAKKEPVPGKAELKMARKLREEGVTEKPADVTLRYEETSKFGLPSIEDYLESSSVHFRGKHAARDLLKSSNPQKSAREFLEMVAEKKSSQDVSAKKAFDTFMEKPGDPVDILNDAVEVASVITRKDFRGVYNKRIRAVAAKPAEIPAELEGLAEEARKYKTVDEFEKGIREAFHYRIPKGEMKVGDKITLSPALGKFNIPLKDFWQAAQKAKPAVKAVKEPTAGKLMDAISKAEEAARQRIKKRGITLKTGIDPGELADYAIIGAAKIGKGAIKFADWSVEMIKEFGDRVKPHLRTIYARSQRELPKFKVNAELDSFLDYFEDIQAPAEFRPPRKPARAAIRERLREEGLRGKELTLETDAEFIKAVHDYGIALRKTKTGKVQPSIRVAGTYVPEDFATYTDFKDAKAGSFGGTKDITRFVEEIDGALSGEARAKLPGQAGPAVRYITWRTRKMTVSRIRWTKAMRSRLKLISEGVSEKQAKLANRVIAHISKEGSYVDPAKLVTNPKISALTTDLNVIRFAQEARKLYESMLRHQNEFRRLIGRTKIAHREYYTAHSIHETTIWERALGHNKTPEQAIGPGLPDYIKPNAPFNARAMARKIGLPETVREMDLRTLLERYIDTAAKDIYNTAIIQNNKAFIQQLESMGYEHAARGLENWTAEAFAGVKGAADRTANLSPTIHKGMRIFRLATLRSVFPFNLRWNVLVQPSSTLLGFTRYGYRNSIRGLYDWTVNKKIRQEIRDNAYSVIVKDQRSARMSQQDIVRGVGTAERLNRGKLKTVADYSNFFTDWVERHVTGWSVATAKRHGASIGLKGRALWEYASEGGSKVQSLYNLEDLPGMLRSEVIKTGAMFQTFKFEAFNTLREFAGKTGMPPATHAIRVKMALRFLAGATVINYIGQVTLGRKPWELASFIPFYGQLVSPVLAAVKGEDVPMTTQRGLPVPLGIGIRGVQATRQGLLKPGVAGIRELIRTGDFKAALEEFMATGKWDKLRRFTIRYLSGYAGIAGGTQMNRVVDGLIAISVGGMEDSAGKMMFPISGTKEKIRTFLGGPWSTESGQEYWDKRGKELNLDIEFMENNPLLRDVTESIPVFGDFLKFQKDSKSQTEQAIQRMIRTGNTEAALDKRLEWNIENPDNKITLKWYSKQLREVSP